MIDIIIRSFGILLGVGALLELISLIYPKYPRIPGDLYINVLGFTIYIPFISAIVVTVILNFFLHFIGK
jgi:hypothetical protein